eukprot:Pgem_evm1s3443
MFIRLLKLIVRAHFRGRSKLPARTGRTRNQIFQFTVLNVHLSNGPYHSSYHSLLYFNLSNGYHSLP